MKISLTPRRLVATAALGLVSPLAVGQVHEGDIVLQVQNTQIVTGTGVGSNFEQRRVFATELGVSFPHFNDAPGFDCEPGTFPAGSRLGFRIQDSLRVWQGGNFATVPDELMELRFGTSLVRTTPPSPALVEGFTLSVASNGQWHRHLGYTLLAPADPGVYLLTLTLTSNAGIAESAPFWIVFNDSADPADAAVAAEWVRVNLAGESGTPSCDSIDFNNDGSLFDPRDIEAFLSVYSEGPCLPLTATCNDIDFNNDSSVFDPRDIESFLSVYSEGPCL